MPKEYSKGNEIHEVDVESDGKIRFLEEQREISQQYIKGLEARLEQRETELRVYDGRQQRTFRKKNRRRGVESLCFEDLRRIHQSKRYVSDAPVGNYLLLTITNFKQENNVNNDNDKSIPIYIRMLQGKMFVVGPNDATIGCSAHCHIKLPTETGLPDTHSIIISKKDVNEETLFFLKNYKLSDNLLTGSTKYDPILYPLTNGSKFQTGNIEWSVSAVPQNKLIISQLFMAVRCKSVSDFKMTLDGLEQWNTATNEQSEKIDVNLEGDLEYRIVNMHNKTACTQSFLTDANNEKFTLLHVAVDYGCIDIVDILLTKGITNVNLQCGSKLLTPLHVAAIQNNEHMVSLLLKFGADLEMKDSHGDFPLNKATSYPVRKMLLLSSLLCSACVGGDVKEVNRILDETNVCINAKALRHHTPLQIACLYDEFEVIQYLLKKQVSVNQVGGQYKRTSLHYASLKDNVAIARALISHGATVNQLDALGYSPLSFCHSPEMCSVLYQGDVSLCLATQCGDVCKVQYLLEENMKEIHLDMISLEALHKTSQGSHGQKTSRQMIMKNLDRCPLVAQKNDQGLAAIHLAAAAGNIDILQILLSYGTRVDLNGGLEKWTPLFFASLSGQPDCIRFLLTMGADKQYCDSRGLLCIDHVERHLTGMKAKLNSTDVNSSKTVNEDIEILIPSHFLHHSKDAHFDMNIELDIQERIKDLNTVVNVLNSAQQKLFNVLEENDITLLDKLLREEEVNVNELLSKSMPISALHYTASMGMDTAFNMLLTYNADPYMADEQSFAPIHAAAENGHESIVKLLIQFGVDVNLQTKIQGYTPLHVAVVKKRKDLIKSLLTLGADTSLRDSNGNTAFDLSTNDEIREILAHGDERLYVAICQNNIKLAAKLLKTIDVNTKFCFDVSPLHIACKRGLVDMAEILILSGAIVNTQDEDENNTPFHFAALGTSTDLIHLLIKYGADVTIQNKNGKTPFEVASNNNMRRAVLTSRKLDFNSNEENSLISPSPSDKCCICYTNKINTIILPCRHQAFCSDCVSQIQVCGFDRQSIQEVLPIYHAT